MRGRLRRISALAVVLALAAVVAVAAASRASAADAGEVTIGERFEPAEIRIPVGGAVTWRNADRKRHRVRSESGPEKFDSGNLEHGERWSRMFTVAGTYSYLDHRSDDDSAYRGTVVVEPAGAAPGDPARPPAADERPPQEQAAASGEVVIADRSFAPASIRVAAGSTVTWANQGGREHTVTAADGSFDSGVLAEGSTYRQQFNEPGAHPYLCLIHPEMTGVVEVAGAAAEAGDEPPPAGAEGGSGAAARTESVPDSPQDGRQAGDGAFVPVTIDVSDFAFEPGQASVAVGTEVIWTVSGPSAHTVTAESGRFDSGLLAAGGTYSYTFEEVGTVRYFCAFHPQMTGVVEVASGESATPGAAARASPTGSPAASPAAATTPTPDDSPTLDPAAQRTVLAADGTRGRPGTTRWALALAVGAVGLTALTLRLVRWTR